MSIKIQDIIANEILPLSRFSTIGTVDAPWDKLYGSFATFPFPTDTPANLNDYQSDSRIYIGDPLNFQGYTGGPNGHIPTSEDLLFVLPEIGNSVKQLLFTNNTVYERSGILKGSWGQWKKFAFEGDSVITLPYVIEPSYINLGNFITSGISSSGTSISTGLVIIKQGQLSSCAMISLDAFGEIKVVEYWNDTGLPLEGGIVYMDDSMIQGSFSLLIPSQATGYLIILQEDEKIPFTGSSTLGHYGDEIPNYFIGNNITTLTSSNFNRWVPKLDGSGAHSSNGPWKIDTLGQVGINQQYVNKTVTGTYYPVFVTPSGETRLLNTIYTSNEDGFDISLSGNTLYLKNGSLDAANVYISGTNLQEHQLTIAGNKISLIGQPNGITANQLRTSLGLSNALHFIGVATNDITDGGTEDPEITGYTSKTAGDVILGKDGNEYLWTGSAWEKLGDESSFKLKQAAKNTNNISSSVTGCNTFISDIEQNEHGEINAIKKTIAPLKIGIAETPYDGSTNTLLSLDNIGAVAKTGDTMTGTLIVPNIRAYTPPYNTNPGYIKMASIIFKNGATWADQSIYLRAVGRANREAEYYISFDQSELPTLHSFKMNNQTNLKAFLHKSADYIWDLYFQKTTAYDKIEILDCKYSSFMEEKMTLNWIGDVVSELPNGYIEPVGDALFTHTIHAQHIIPNKTNQYDLGTSNLKWKNIYGDNFYGNANSANKVNKKLQFYKLDSSVENGISHLADKDYDGSVAQFISLRSLAESTELQKYINYTGGSNIEPVYFDKGALVVGNLYAGGSKIVLNGIDKSSSEASFYAPTSAGEKDQYLKFDDSGVPVWATTIVSNSWRDGQVAGPKLTVSVNGISSESTIPIATTGNSGVVTTDTQSFSGAKTFTNTLTLSNGKLQASTTFYLSSAENTSIIFQNGTTEAGRFNPSGCLNLGGHASTSSAFKLNIKGNALINTSNAGWYLTDGTGYNYPGVYDNTTNLWIGAVKAASKHHTGNTIISTGYNKDTSTGNTSIQIAIPNANNDGATLRRVLHEGYIAGKSGVNYGTAAQRDALTATAATGQMFFVLI